MFHNSGGRNTIFPTLFVGEILFLQGWISAYLSNISYSALYGLVSGVSILLHWCVSLWLCIVPVPGFSEYNHPVVFLEVRYYDYSSVVCLTLL